MSDDFFDFDPSRNSDGGGSDEEDKEYDRLNSETFGDTNANDVGDWEESHEKLSGLAELSKKEDISNDDENGAICAMKMTQFILDDDDCKTDSDEENDTEARGRNSIQQPIQQKPTDRTFGPNKIIQPLSQTWFENLKQKDQHLVPIVPPMKQYPSVRRLPPPQQGPLIRPMQPSQQPQTSGVGLPVMPHVTQIRHPGPASFVHPQGVPQIMSRVYPASNNPPIQQRPPVYPPNLVGTVGIRQPRPIGPRPVGPIPPTFRMQQMATHNFFVPVYGQQQRHMMLPHNYHQHQYQVLYPQNRPNIDEYANLMTLQEKNWLAQIQLIQLSTNQPFRDDYYNTMFQHRQQGSTGHKVGGPSPKSSRDMNHKPAYTPLQFENSLGKLQVGSVTAPRKIIDTDVVENVECPTQVKSRKAKQILLEIEHMYTQVILLEDSQNPIANPPSESFNPKIIVKEIMWQLLRDNKLQMFMGIRKGRMLVLRLLPHVEQPGPILRKIVSSMQTLSRKDQSCKDTDQILLRFLPYIRTWITKLEISELVILSTSMYSSLQYILTNKFTVSVLTNMIERAEDNFQYWSCKDKTNDHTDYEESWLNFLSRVVACVNADSTIGQTKQPVERPVVGARVNFLEKHFRRVKIAFGQLDVLVKALGINNAVN